MNKSLKTTLLVGLGIAFLVGIILFAVNKDYLEYSRLVNPTYAEDQVDDLHRAQAILGHSLSDTDSMMSIYEKKMDKGDAALFGIVLSIISAVSFVIFLIVMVNKNKEVQYATVQPNKSISDQLNELSNLREKGLLSEEEYASAKSKLLN